jgi:hypothetical protein
MSQPEDTPDTFDCLWRRQLDRHAATCELANIFFNVALGVIGIAIFLNVSSWLISGGTASLW